MCDIVKAKGRADFTEKRGSTMSNATEGVMEGETEMFSKVAIGCQRLGKNSFSGAIVALFECVQERITKNRN